MAKIIAICNQKGGVGKTTTTLNIGVGMVRQGKRVLLVDADPQSDFTHSLGWNADEQEASLGRLMYNEIGRYGVNVREAFMANNNTEVTFEIMEHIGVIDARKDGWNKEVNIVAWNGGQPLPTDIATKGILISPLP